MIKNRHELNELLQKKHYLVVLWTDDPSAHIDYLKQFSKDLRDANAEIKLTTGDIRVSRFKKPTLEFFMNKQSKEIQELQ